MEIYYNLLLYYKFCDEKKIEDLEMDKDSLYLAFEEVLFDCTQPGKKAAWGKTRKRPVAKPNFFS